MIFRGGQEIDSLSEYGSMNGKNNQTKSNINGKYRRTRSIRKGQASTHDMMTFDLTLTDQFAFLKFH